MFLLLLCYAVVIWSHLLGDLQWWETPYPGVDPLSVVQLLENGQRLNKPANSACPDEM